MDKPLSPNEMLELYEAADDREQAMRGITPATMESYRSLAKHFYKRIEGIPSPKKITDALKAAASDYRPAYWRKLRNALMYDQNEKAFYEAADRISKTKNPVTAPGSEQAVKKKQTRAKSTSSADMIKLAAGIKEINDPVLTAATRIAKLTGCRPAEMTGIKCLSGNRLHITGAKKAKGLRGLDRTVEVPEGSWNVVQSAVAVLNAADPGKAGVMHKVQSKLDRLTKKLWPRRKARITLYSFRHQMGSDLKASGLDRKQIAYVMGHQSTQSIEVYGNRRSSSGKSAIRPEPDADMSMIRENHRAPGPERKAPAPSAPSREPGYSGASPSL